jgi:hypothetical protein
VSYTSVPEFAEEHNIDSSLLRKMLKALDIPTIRAKRESTKKSTTAFEKKHIPKILKEYPNLTLSVAKATDVPVSAIAFDLAKIRGTEPDISTVLKMCEARGIKLTKVKIRTRSVTVISKKDYTNLMNELKEIVMVS